MSNSYFRFKQFTVQQDECAMKVTTDSCFFGAWVADKHLNNVANVLDIGTGTGLLSLMYAQKNKAAIIDAVEIDAQAAKQASKNIMASPWKERINIFNADACHFNFKKQYDLIISNPPFYENELTSPDNQKNIAHHHSALLLNDLPDIIKTNLHTQGIVCLLLPFKRLAEVKLLFAKHELLINEIVFIKPSVNHNYSRVIIAGNCGSQTNKAQVISEIAVKDINNEYTSEFTRLLKDYYLYI